jgi:hypothetical protein
LAAAILKVVNAHLASGRGLGALYSMRPELGDISEGVTLSAILSCGYR